MGLRIDLHLHTKRYSACSQIEPDRLIDRAVRAGLDGVVITEHHHQWTDRELSELVERSGHPGFRLLAGFEYTSSHGDILIYGLEPDEAKRFTPRWAPEKALELAYGLGAVCIAAHPTRAGLSFDDRIINLQLNAIEVRSVNLQAHEQALALKLSGTLGIPPVTCSDAHRLEDVGRFATVFSDVITTREDLKAALSRGRFSI
ncbi:MAG: hypothetical protein AMXMBFR84_48840 [Candidatus Hydrogenedentota bacterium]